MAHVLIVSSSSEFPFDIWRHGTEFLLRHSAELDPFGQHHLTDDPEKADLILFAEQGTAGKFVEMVRAHPLYRRYPQKCFVFDNADFCCPTVPGIYASLPEEKYKLGYTRTGFYFLFSDNPFVIPRPCTGKEPYLATFVGAKRTHLIREKFFQFGRGDIYVRDTSGYSQRSLFESDPPERERVWREYADAMADALFSLCPRGQSPGSIRLSESMKMGRACVIVSDAWHPNDEVNWSEFSIRVPERDVERIPEILDRERHRAPQMGARARQVWEEHFSERVRFHRIVELCLDLQRQTRRGRLARWSRLARQIGTPQNLRSYLSSKKNLYRNNGKVYW